MMKNLHAVHPRPRLSRLVAGVVGCSVVASSALAQDAAIAPTNATTMKPTVVTGTYLPVSEGATIASPVDVLSSARIREVGVADPLMTLKRTVPGFTGSGNYFGTANNNVNLGAGYQAFTSESYASLRNLPTLVLLDGQRIVSSAFSGGQAIDLNSIPLAMIDRIEVLKDGASAVYGSDAIGGVINIITKKNYNGVEIYGRYGFATEGPKDHGAQYQASILVGSSSEHTRFTAGAQLFEQNPLLTKDRKFASQGIADLAAQNIVPPAYVSPSYPGKVQAGGISYILAGSTLAQGGPGYNPGLTSPPVFPGQQFTGANSIVNYNNYAIAHGYVDPTGNGLGPYVPISATPTGQQLDAIGSGEGSAWPALNTTQFGTTTFLEQDRRQFWANAEHDIFPDTLTVYSHFLYSGNQAKGDLAPSPAPSLNGSGIFVPANNPYNPFGIDLGVNGATTPRVRSRFVDFGNREFVSYSDFFQWVGGLRGEISPNYSWDASYDYSQTRQEQQTRNAVNGAGLNNALTPLIDAGTGGYVLDEQGRPLSRLIDFNGNNLPVYNIFGSGLNTAASVNAPETIDALRATLFTWGQSELWSAQGVFRGTPLTLPGGKLSFAAGGQYQDESISLQVDGLTKLGLVPGLNPAQDFPGGTRKTSAGFIEVGIPVTGPDMAIPGLYSFEITAAGRYQVFDPGGDAAVPKVGILWKPLDEQITVRGGYSQGFIAPSIFNLFGPDFVSNPNVGIQGSSGQVTTQTRANPNLEPSDSEQYGGGVVLKPKFVEGLTLSADYYHVVLNHIPVADAQSVANSLNTLGSGSPFAPGFSFSDGTRLTTTAPNQVTIDNWGNAIFPWQPAGSLKTEGIDLQANYVLPEAWTEGFGRISFDGKANVILSHQLQQSPERPFFEYKGTFTAFQGLIPDWTMNLGVTWQILDFTFVANANYIPPTQDPGLLFGEYGGTEQGFTVNGKPWTISDYFTVDLQLSYELGKRKLEGRHWYDGTKLTVGCLNVSNEQPPLIPDAIEDNTDKNNYDILGRFVYFEITKRF
jgi:iron complex outermembrane receptor protein